MQITEFAEQLYEELEKQMSVASERPTIDAAKDQSSLLLYAMAKLRDHVIENKFISHEEEINFFKHIKPRFLSKLIYYQKIFALRSEEPPGMNTDVRAYYLEELSAIKNYITDNRELLIYYRCGSMLLDEIYFTRKEKDIWLSLKADEFDNDRGFTTVYDQKLSKLMAYEQLAVFIIEVINELQDTATGLKTARANVTWTGPKAALIELLYALQTAGACNNGTIEVKQLAGHFEELFNVHLGNFYRTFQEIRIRKTSRTTFLDQLKESLIKRMDTADENPRF